MSHDLLDSLTFLTTNYVLKLNKTCQFGGKVDKKSHRLRYFTINYDRADLSELTQKRQWPTWRRSEARCPDISEISRYRPIWADIWRSLTIGLDRLKIHSRVERVCAGHGPGPGPAHGHGRSQHTGTAPRAAITATNYARSVDLSNA